MKLENWSICTPKVNPFTAPELIPQCLQGNVYGHPRFRDGEFVISSRIVGIKENLILTYSGSTYELGEPDPDYEDEYPDAKSRVLNSLMSN